MSKSQSANGSVAKNTTKKNVNGVLVCFKRSYTPYVKGDVALVPEKEANFFLKNEVVEKVK